VGSQELFKRYLAASVPDDDPESILETLLADCAQPVLTHVVRSRLGSLYTPEDAAELSSEAMVELLSRLRTLHEHPESARPDFQFEALAAGVAANTVHRFFAKRFPERNRLRKQIRYVVETGDRFHLWLGAKGTAVCGLAGSSENGLLASAADVERCLDGTRKRPFPAHPLATLVHEILRSVSRPIDLSRLTNMVAGLTGVREPACVSYSAGAQSDSGEEEAARLPADPAPSAAMRLELRQRLESLWREVLLLPGRHRSALLLSARAPNGAAVGLVVDLGIASFREAADALEMSVEELAELWNRLPLEDNEIAARLSLERQQVINLRSTAREKLERRDIQAGYGVKPIRGLSRS